jgi:uncharacterized protein (UPF0276 family)
MHLLDRGQVDVDWIKLSVWADLPTQLAAARPVRPCLLHTLPEAGQAEAADPRWTWDELNRAIAACGSPHVALHLGAPPAAWPSPPGDAEILDRLVANTRAWAAKVEVPLLVENVPFYGFRGSLRRATDPDAIRAVCDEADAGLLLDLAHARVAAWHRGEEATAYLAALPLDRVAEIHVCGPRLEERGLMDRHLDLAEEDFALLRWTLEHTTARIVTLEYGGTGPLFETRSDVDLLKGQLDRLTKICRD